MNDFSELRESLNNGPNRVVVMQLMQKATSIPATLRGLAYIMIQRLPDEKLVEYQRIAVTALDAVNDKDFDKLETILRENDIPEGFTAFIRSMAMATNE